jgi:hypothetical protein
MTNKLERLPLTTLSSYFQYLQVRLEPTQVEHYSFPSKIRYLVKPQILDHARNACQVTNALAYFVSSSVQKKKNVNGAKSYKTFFGVN